MPYADNDSFISDIGVLPVVIFSNDNEWQEEPIDYQELSIGLTSWDPSSSLSLNTQGLLEVPLQHYPSSTSSNAESSPESLSPASQTVSPIGDLAPLPLVTAPEFEILGLYNPPPLPAISSRIHQTERIPGTENEVIDQYLMKDPYNPRKLTCTWDSCVESFEGRTELAREHIRAHLTITKLFKCSACPREFTTYRAARRHRDTQEKLFFCGICSHGFARKDYARKHQRKCAERAALIHATNRMRYT